jgi:hypothetical protein
MPRRGQDVHRRTRFHHERTVILTVKTELYVQAAASLSSDFPLLVARPLIDPPVTREIDVAHRDDRSLSPAAEVFVRLLKMGATQLQLPSERLLDAEISREPLRPSWHL